MDAALICDSAGSQLLRHVLTTYGIDDAFEQIQQRGGLSDASCEPLLGLLEHLGQGRAEVYGEMLQTSLSELRGRLDRLSQPALLKLLNSSFKYVGIEELRELPLAALGRLHTVPVDFLQQACLLSSAAKS
jgi:negative elongation factor B